MTNRFMISVAVFALMAGTGLANAQSGGMGREGPSAGQQSGASSDYGTSGGQMKHDATRPEMKSPTAGKNQHSENAEKGKTVGQSMKNEGREDKNAQREGREENKNAQRNDERMNGNKNAQRNDERMNENRNAQRNDERMNEKNAQRNGERMNNEAEGKTTDRHSQTVGQAGAGAKLSTEQRTKITSVIKEQHVAPVSHANFSISVGTRVPRDVTFHTLPTEVVSIYPEWRGFEYILVGDQLVVVDPHSMEIVAVLDT
ncbi:MAG: DUF1236 domain-containing protein [Bradyrhizobium sp.]|nr:DUF1236 domain-containing protein [Bradyrhizobium sp.]